MSEVVAGADDERDVFASGPGTAGPPLAMAGQARGGVVDRPQAVAAMTPGIIGLPLPGEELATQGEVIRGRRTRLVLHQPSGTGRLRGRGMRLVLHRPRYDAVR